METWKVNDLINTAHSLAQTQRGDFANGVTDETTFLNMAVKAFFRDYGSWEAEKTSDITLVNGTREYALPAGLDEWDQHRPVLFRTSATATTWKPLTYVPRSEVDGYEGETANEPKFWYVTHDTSRNKVIGFLPTPNATAAAGQIKLRYRAKVADVAAGWDANTELDLPDEARIVVVHLIAALFARADNDPEMSNYLQGIAQQELHRVGERTLGETIAEHNLGGDLLGPGTTRIPWPHSFVYGENP